MSWAQKRASCPGRGRERVERKQWQIATSMWHSFWTNNWPRYPQLSTPAKPWLITSQLKYTVTHTQAHTYAHTHRHQCIGYFTRPRHMFAVKKRNEKGVARLGLLARLVWTGLDWIVDRVVWVTPTWWLAWWLCLSWPSETCVAGGDICILPPAYCCCCCCCTCNML